MEVICVGIVHRKKMRKSLLTRIIFHRSMERRTVIEWNCHAGAQFERIEILLKFHSV